MRVPFASGERRFCGRFVKFLMQVGFRPGNEDLIYESLVESLRDLGFSGVCLARFDLAFQYSGYYGDESLLDNVREFSYKVSRKHVDGVREMLCIPMVYGYFPPVRLCVVFDRTQKNRRSLQSLFMTCRILYYHMRCAGLQEALDNQYKFLRMAEEYGVISSPPEGSEGWPVLDLTPTTK